MKFSRFIAGIDPFESNSFSPAASPSRAPLVPRLHAGSDAPPRRSRDSSSRSSAATFEVVRAVLVMKLLGICRPRSSSWRSELDKSWLGVPSLCPRARYKVQPLHSPRPPWPGSSKRPLHTVDLPRACQHCGRRSRGASDFDPPAAARPPESGVISSSNFFDGQMTPMIAILRSLELGIVRRSPARFSNSFGRASGRQLRSLFQPWETTMKSVSAGGRCG